MMVILEVLGVLVVAVVVITALVSICGPVASILASKTRFKYDSLGSEAEVLLKKRVADLEEEVRQLRHQLLEVKETTEFAVKMIEQSGADKSLRLVSTSDKKIEG